MNLLLDTHVLIWWILNSRKLGRRARAVISRSAAGVFISAVSVWEISIKVPKGRLTLREPLDGYLPSLFENGFRPLPINIAHALAIRTLPPHHGDPFDRMLIAQAQCERLTLVTVDPLISAYGVPTLDATA